MPGKNSVINIASYIDHTILKPVTTYIEIKKICEEAWVYGFAAVCVPPPLVVLARETLATSLKDSSAVLRQGRQTGISGPRRVKVATVIGFPFGYSAAKAKLSETDQALADGADELDVVINLVALKNGDWDLLGREMVDIINRAHGQGKIVKVIIESGILKEEEIIRCCELYSKLGADFVKTSTGYAERGATLEAVQLMRRHLPPEVKIKASGGIRTYAFARELVAAGADRLGCSASVAIVEEEKKA
jgi:deoxyribose-phosphate aldolase